MAIKWENTIVTAVKWGSINCTAVYWGNTKVFPNLNYTSADLSLFNIGRYYMYAEKGRDGWFNGEEASYSTTEFYGKAICGYGSDDFDNIWYSHYNAYYITKSKVTLDSFSTVTISYRKHCYPSNNKTPYGYICFYVGSNNTISSPNSRRIEKTEIIVEGMNSGDIPTTYNTKSIDISSIIGEYYIGLIFSTEWDLSHQNNAYAQSWVEYLKLD